jgi:hypothetical protein
MTLTGKSCHKGETQQQTHTPEAKHEEHPGLENFNDARRFQQLTTATSKKPLAL